MRSLTLSVVYVNRMTLTSALGTGLSAMRENLASSTGGLRPSRWPDSDVPCFLGEVDLSSVAELPAARRSRNNRLIELALEQDGFASAVADEVARAGAHRVGVVMGTSTSGIDRAEEAFRHLDADGRFEPQFWQPQVFTPHAPGDYVAERLGLQGPCLTVSAACASSAKVFAVARRWLEQDLVDAVVVGGADNLCLSVIYGFHSLQLVAPEPCRPFSPDRQGISLGEAAGFALLTRKSDGLVRLAGVGESCDAYHMSSAHPDGLGAKLSMQRALDAADLTLAQVDYVNLHGTGTRANDDVEGRVCAAMADDRTLFSATKGWTGHTLGAAGIVESVLTINAIVTGLVPGTMNTQVSEAGFNLLLNNEQHQVRRALTNSFGFGGNNCSVVFEAI
ncbi:MAG: beta-ketoacyl-ACP synthase [Proteobacteria bacterium]|nr:beta-ketoacyl-ACP synthase [Pseudomonadota bacterium]